MTKYAPDVLAERVFLLIEAIPPGRATTYGAVGEAAGCGPRQVARLVQELGGLPWWRLVNAQGKLPTALMLEARLRWAEEGTPTFPDGSRVYLAGALVEPDELVSLLQYSLPDD